MNKTFRKIVFCTCIMILLIYGTSCNNKSTIKIGLLTDITGRSSLLGVSARNAIELAIEEYNNGDHPYTIRLVVKDDKGLNDEMKKAVEAFDKEGIQLIIGPYTSNIASEIIDTQMNLRDDILFISPTVSTNKVMNIDDHFITLLSENEEQGILLAITAFNNGLRKVATVYEYNNRSYSQPLTAAFERTFVELGGEIVYSSQFTTSEDAPFAQLAKEMIDKGSEGVLIVAGGLDASQLAQFIHKDSPDIQIYCGMWAKTLDFISNGGKAVEGAYLASIFEGNDNNDTYNQFIQEYTVKYNADITFPAVCTYEAAQLLFSVMDESPSTNPVDIKNGILVSGYTGLSNDFVLDEFGDCNRPYVIYKVKEGKYVKVKE